MEIGNIHYMLHHLREQSECIDKQVSCIITDKDNNILSFGWNKVLECDKNCHDKENRLCVTKHAEIVAIDRLTDAQLKMKGKKIYVSLFPCKPCQNACEKAGVEEIISFTPDHKGTVFNKITIIYDFNDRMLNRDSVHTHNELESRDIKIKILGGRIRLIGNMIEHYHEDMDERHLKYLIDDIALLETSMEQLKLSIWTKYPELYNVLREIREQLRI